MARADADDIALALPSKGELHERTLQFLDLCGMRVQAAGNRREYTARLRGVEGMRVVFLRADEIPLRIAQGGVHVGITGEDLFREHGNDSGATHLLLRELGYGHADLVVAVPRAWIDVATIEDLEEVALLLPQTQGRSLRVATKYPRLTRAFLTGHGITDFVVVRSLGATEGAPATGTADIIVDLASTGATLAQNHLKPVLRGTVLSSQASVLTALRAELWSDGALATLAQFVDLIEARLRAQTAYTLRFVARSSKFDAAETELRVRHRCEVLSRSGIAPATERGDEAVSDRVEVAMRCPAARLHAVVDRLRQAEVRDVAATRADFIFGERSEAVEGFRLLLRRIDRRGDG